MLTNCHKFAVKQALLTIVFISVPGDTGLISPPNTPMPTPHTLNTRYLSVEDVAHMIQRMGLPNGLAQMAQRIEADYRRWPSFDKVARVAAHSPDGVIELMPIADDVTYTPKTPTRACPRSWPLGSWPMWTPVCPNGSPS
jgi:hypothetical protein